MRKVLSIVLALLMVSMMIPSMAFAADVTLVDGAPTAALVATEKFTLTANEDVTVKVNANVFSLAGGTPDSANAKIQYVALTAGNSVEVTVADAIPAEQFTSRIRIEFDTTVEYIPVTIKDRLIGDVNGVDGITTYDAAQLLAYAAEAYSVVDATFKKEAADVNGVDKITTYDAAQLLAHAAEAYSVVDANAKELIGKYIGGNDTTVDVDEPSWESTTPEVIKLAKPDATKVLAYADAENGKLVYQFDKVDGADGYVITASTGETYEVTEVTGTIEDFVYSDDMTITVTATTTVEGYANSDASDAVPVTEYPAAGPLTQWLQYNNLQYVVITVHEIN